jgi:glycosyltransferase involved in cell wall biosynthesis
MIKAARTFDSEVALRHGHDTLERHAIAPTLVASRALRLALFSGNYNCVRDGANQALNRLVAFLLRQPGVDVRVYSPTVSSPAFPAAGELVSVPSVPIPGRREYRLALGLLPNVRKDLERFRPDIVHVSAPDLLGRMAQRYARAHGLPTVVSLHTRFESYFDYYGLGFLKGAVERYLARFYHDCDRLLVPNQLIASEFAAAGNADRVSIWGRGVDREIFSPARRDPQWRAGLGYREDEIAVLFLGRLVREKGIETFCRTIEGARERGHRLRPLIVGDGPERAAMAKRLRDAIFLGHLSAGELGRAVASADIFLNPSRTEAFGNVTLEAMAAGIPILSADVPSAQALVEHGRSALLVPPFGPEAYVDALDALIRDPALRRRLAQAAIADAGRYNWEETLQDVFDLYQKCLRPRAGRKRR